MATTFASGGLARDSVSGKLDVPSPTEGAIVTERVGEYQFHFLEAPGGRKACGDHCTVLVMGMGSEAPKVEEARYWLNPATGRPYDLIIGVGVPGHEVSRVLEGTINPEQNADALVTAMQRRFGAPLQAGTIDMHSNGVSVGLAALERGGFRDVRALNLMGPDSGIDGRNIDPARLAGLKKFGPTAIQVMQVEKDMIPAGGSWLRTATTLAMSVIPSPNVGIFAHASRPAPASSPADDGAYVTYEKFQYKGSWLPDPTDPHALKGYLFQRTLLGFETAVAKGDVGTMDVKAIIASLMSVDAEKALRVLVYKSGEHEFACYDVGLEHVVWRVVFDAAGVSIVAPNGIVLARQDGVVPPWPVPAATAETPASPPPVAAIAPLIERTRIYVVPGPRPTPMDPESPSNELTDDETRDAVAASASSRPVDADPGQFPYEGPGGIAKSATLDQQASRPKSIDFDNMPEKGSAADYPVVSLGGSGGNGSGGSGYRGGSGRGGRTGAAFGQAGSINRGGWR